MSVKQGDVLLTLVRNAASWLLSTNNAAVAVMALRSTVMSAQCLYEQHRSLLEKISLEAGTAETPMQLNA